ncbi:hypothetical protein [Kitasatospora sp. NPDC056181]|uniref:hypothetical protein n=1 Tax=Kitasatospora sp. NPDC056181 TaxID=3345737 RepID=UPI0035D772A7
MGSDARTFGSWHLRGGRYEQHGLPVDVLSEFARYQRLVVDVARGLYKQRFMTRQRVPRGFASGFSLRLAAVHEGSVVPVLEVSRPNEPDLFDWNTLGIFEDARVLIQDTLRAVSEGERIPPTFPVHALREFSTFGRSLQEDEFIEFDPGTDHAAVYSQAVRRSLQERAKLDKFEVETLVTGQVTGIYADDGSFKFRLSENGKVISGHFSSDDVVPDLKQYLDLSSMAPTVALSTVAIQSMTEDIIEIQDVLGIEPVLPPELVERLTELSKLESGWLEGAGEEISKLVLRQAESLLLGFLDEGIERPRIFPTDRSGVQFEWTGTQGEVTAEITRDEKVELYAYSKTDDDDEEEATYKWSQFEDVISFLRRGIREYAG